MKARKALLWVKLGTRRKVILDLFRSTAAKLVEDSANIEISLSRGRCLCLCRRDYVRLASHTLSTTMKSILHIHASVGAHVAENLSSLTDTAWTSVLDGKLRVGDAVRESMAKRALECQLTRIYNISAIGWARDIEGFSSRLPLRVSPNDPFTFFRYTKMFLADRYVQEKLFTYYDVLSFMRCRLAHRSCLASLTDTVYNETRTDGTSYEPETWVVDTEAAFIAMVLLEQLGFQICSKDERDEGGSGNFSLPSMSDMLAKGAFVCTCCPEDRREKLGWQELASDRLSRHPSNGNANC